MPPGPQTNPVARRAFFALLYFSEGAPIGYIWWAMPTRLADAGMPTDKVAGLVALLALPWALKFLWAPAVDRLRGPIPGMPHSRVWGRRMWITAAQLAMGLALLPLGLLPAETVLPYTTLLLLAHAVAAATQDVAIDALAIETIPEHERARTTGWMQAGMLLGRALFGGLALVLEQLIGGRAVVLILIACIWITLAAVWLAPVARPTNNTADPQPPPTNPTPPLLTSLARALARRSTWIGLAIALTAGAGFEAVGGLIGPFLLSRGSTPTANGWFLAIPVVACMIAGGLIGGLLADRTGHRQVLGVAVVAIAINIALLAAAATLNASHITLMTVAAPMYFALGALVASSYALFMDLTDPTIGGTQFSAFMSATNLCEAWAVALAGTIAAKANDPAAFLTTAAISLTAIFLLPLLPAGAKAASQKP